VRRTTTHSGRKKRKAGEEERSEGAATVIGYTERKGEGREEEKGKLNNSETTRVRCCVKKKEFLKKGEGRGVDSEIWRGPGKDELFRG
jgi:hypothetical protein